MPTAGRKGIRQLPDRRYDSIDVGSGCPAVLVDQSTEDVDPLDPDRQVNDRLARRDRDLEPEASVWSGFVVVPQVLGEYRCTWWRFQISVQSRHSARTVRTHRSAYAFACGAAAESSAPRHLRR
jgi:hypothetical protein